MKNTSTTRTPEPFVPEFDLTAAEILETASDAPSAFEKAVDVLAEFDPADRARFCGTIKVACNTPGNWIYFRRPNGEKIQESEVFAKLARRALAAAAIWMGNVMGGNQQIPPVSISVIGRIVRVRTTTLRAKFPPMSVLALRYKHDREALLAKQSAA